MQEIEKARQQFLELRDSIDNAQLATLNEDGSPEASYAPVVWFHGHCHLFLSQLARHTRNIDNNPLVSLILIEQRSANSNPFARRRISLKGRVQSIDRGQALFGEVMAEFRRCFGDVMQLIEPLPDFQLYRVKLEQGRFIRGFGQAYDLVGDQLDRLEHVDPRS